MNYQEFLNAAKLVAESKGIEVDNVLAAIKEAIARGYVRSLGGGDDAVVDVTLDEEHGTIVIAQIKDVVEEVEDDYLEITVEDAIDTADEERSDIEEKIAETKDKDERNQLKFLLTLVESSVKNLKPGDRFPIYCPIESLRKITVSGIQSALRSNIRVAEQTALYEVYKDHIGEMLTGTVEKAGDRSVSVNIGSHTVVELTAKELIGDEIFKVGDPIKVYLQEVKEQRTPEGKLIRGPQIEVTRASSGFLKRLFEEEIHEIYDGTVVIKGIARDAGIRSKVAVYSKDDDIDPTGACIGPKGSRIQKIVQQLGNGKDKEKIDIIAYSDYMPLYIAESLRPAQVLGVAMEGEGDDENARPVATVIVNDGDTRLAIGRRGANVRLAKKLTGWDIDIVPLSEATEDGLVYTPIEQIKEEAAKAKKEKDKAEYLASSLKAAAEKATMKAEEEKPEEAPLEEAPAAEETPAAPAEEKAEAPKAEPAVEAKAEEAPKAAETPAAPAVEKPAKPVVHTEVKTTTTLEDLEKELSEKKDEPTRRGGEKKRRPRRISEEEVERVKPSEMPANVLPIYSDEELAEIEAEESEESLDDDIDESDYDQYDSYYDDDGK